MKNFKKFALSSTQQRNTFGQGRREKDSAIELDHAQREYDERIINNERTRRDVNGGDSGTPPSDDE